jgi:Zn-dependent protease with chaperone function
MFCQKRVSITALLTGLLLIFGCAPAQYMPQFDDTTLRTKQREISSQTERVPHEISEDPNAVLSRIYNRLEPRAREACIANGEKWLDSSCSNWRVQVLDDENFNAYATPNHEIVFTTEVFRYTKSDDELAFILAHEMGHHILNHAMEDVINAEIMGATTGLLSGILMGAIASGLGASESTVNDVIEDAIEDGYESGRESGRLTYSIDQESEADKLALQLIELADYSQAEARDIMLFIGADSNDLRSKHNASHPSGAERLAAFDLYASLPSDRSYSVSTSSNSVVIKKIKHTYPTGEVYEGGWAKGIPHGKGRQTWPSGHVYEGDFVKGWMSGSGKWTYPNGNIYEGEFVNNVIHGHGKLTFGNEDYYIGEFINGLKHGRGIERVDRVTTKGVWRDGSFSHDAYVSEKEFDYHVNKKSILERSGDYESDLIQVKLIVSTAYSCMYKHDDQWVAFNVHEVPRRVCPKHVYWPEKGSTKIFDKTQSGTIPNTGVSLKLNKSISSANVCAYSVAGPNDMLIPKGTGAVCPQIYEY